jgi:hypothetical protein
LKAFEDDLVKLIQNISFRDINEPFLNTINKDLKTINNSKNVYVFADKTKNIYEISPTEYNKLLTENITKSYKLGYDSITADINEELCNISSQLNIGNRIDVMAETEAFITLKDHKDNFESKPKCRLINPAKSELGKVSKVILDSINQKIRSTTDVNQWINSQSVINWFKEIEHKSRYNFVSFDVVDFYPSITEDLLDKAIAWAKTIVNISDEHVSIIKHSRKSVLFNCNKPWIKRDSPTTFDVTMGSFDGAEICELVGLYALNKLRTRFGNKNIGLYRDDGLALIEGTSLRLADKARKDLCSAFQELGLKITAEVNYKIVNFLDVTLNLTNESYKPYRKPNNEPLYIHKESNHPPPITKHLPEAINRRIATLSSDKQTFDSVAPTYNNALKQSNYKANLQYPTAETTPTTNSPSQNEKRKRTRNIIWFNPPYSKTVRTNVARDFLRLIDRHFPKTSPLHKIFNRNTIKVSYSCMNNVKSVISRHNKRVLREAKSAQEPTNKDKKTLCNCRNVKECPLNNMCLTKDLVYQAEVTTKDDNDRKTYIGMTATTFKDRYRNHKKSFDDIKYENETELSKHVWKLKLSEKQYKINWSILSRASSIKAGGNTCSLCLEEKLQILRSYNSTSVLNKRSELFTKCVHARRFRAGRFKRTCVSKYIASSIT